MATSTRGYWPYFRDYLKSLPREIGRGVLQAYGIRPIKRDPKGVWEYTEARGWRYFIYGTFEKPPYKK